MTQHAPDSVPSPWQVSGNLAQLALRGLDARLNLAMPESGLCDVSVLGRLVPSCVLGAHFAGADAETIAWGAVSEGYARGADLVGVYEATDECPFRTTLYWRADGGLAGHDPVTLDLILSIQTHLLDVTPRLATRTCFSDAEIVLFPPSADRTRLDLDRGELLADLPPDTEIACAMVRLAAVDATYCEFIHPSDWRSVDVRQDEDRIELNWSLVGHFLEKGVIRRMRVRGIYLMGRAKEKHVSDLYAEFANSPPPLTA